MTLLYCGYTLKCELKLNTDQILHDKLVEASKRLKTVLEANLIDPKHSARSTLL